MAKGIISLGQEQEKKTLIEECYENSFSTLLTDLQTENFSNIDILRRFWGLGFARLDACRFTQTIKLLMIMKTRNEHYLKEGSC